MSDDQVKEIAEGTVLGRRYRLDRPLGEGGQGSVWAASDLHVAGRPVALKLLAAGRVEPEQQMREYAVLARLRHPGLAAALDLGRTAGGLFIVSELVDGPTLARWLAARPLATRIAMLCRLLGTLDFVHRRGVVHRDLKPDNVLVVGEQTKLVDFGLATSLDEASELVGGTAGFIAPEVLAGGAASPLSDLYAVGVMLHLVLWDRVPFADMPPSRVVARQLGEDVRLPRGRVPGALRELAAQALAREPGQRPASAAEMLEQLLRVPSLGLSADADEYLVGHGLPEPRLIGREAPLRQYAARLDGLAAGEPQRPVGLLVVGVHPGGGLGTTRLCEELAAAARLRGVRVRRGMPRAGHQTDEPALGPEARAAALLVEPVEPVEVVEPVEPGAERARAVERVTTSVRALLTEPLLLLFDEQAEAATDELALLAPILLAASRLGAESPLLICVAARRGGELDRQLGGVFERLELGPLSAEQTAELAASMLPSRWLTPALGPALHRRSGGNPGRAAELLRLAAARRSRGRAEGSAADELARLVEREVITEAAADLAAARVAALPAEQRTLVARLALFADEGLRRPALRSLAGEDRGPGGGRLDALDGLLMQGLVLEADDGRLLLASRAVGEAALAALDPAARREHVARGLAWLEQRGASEQQRALLVVTGGQAAEAPELVLQGARAARRDLDLSVAARLYRAATASGEGAALAELAAVLLATGQHDEACELLEAAAGEARGDRRLEATRALADARLRAGQPGEALEALERASGRGGSAWRARLATLRAKALLFAGRWQEAAEAADELVDAGEVDVAADARQTLALARCYLGELDEALAWAERALELVDADEERPLLQARVLNTLALVCQQRFELDRAADHYGRCLGIAERLGHLPFAATFLMNLGAVAQQQGRYAEALERYERSLAVAERFGGAREMAQVLHNLGRLLAQLGQPSRALHHLRRSRALAEALGWRSLAGHDLIVAAEVALAEGDLDRAGERLERARGVFDELGEAMGQLDVGLVAARLLLAGGEAEGARDAAEAVQRQAGELEVLQLQAMLVAVEAELSRPGADGAAAMDRLGVAERLADKLGEQDCRIELQLLRARGAAARGDGVGEGLARLAARRLLDEQTAQVPPSMRAAFRAVPRRAAAAQPAATVAPSPPSQGSTIALTPGAARNAALDASLLAALLEISKELNAERDLTRLLERIIDHAVELTGAERGFLLIRRRGAPDGQLEVQVARNIDHERIQRKTLKVSRSIAEEVMRTGRPVVAVDAMGDERFERFRSVHEMRLRSVLCVPLTIRRELRGAIYLDNRFQVEAFDLGQQQLLSALADQAALAVGNWELNEENRARQLELQGQRAELAQLNEQLRDAMASQSLRLDELTRLTQTQQGELQGRYRFENLVGRSAPMREVFRLIERVNDSAAPVFVHGESGTGKELVCKAIHYSGARKEGPLVTVNCGAIPPSLLESELFGFDKGAFTGADRGHRGLFERADGGSLMLDEVGDMSAELQVKLLRVLQDKRFVRLGGEREQASDFRLLSASNKDLGELVRQGVFREDLYYRINVITIGLPPLRDRREDVPLLVEHLLQRHGGEGVSISPETLRLLIDFDWPGNARELENEVLRLLALGGEHLEPRDLSPRILERGAGRRGSPRRSPVAGTLKEGVQALERQMALEALRVCRGRVTEAARRLGMSRVGLHKLMRRHGIERAEIEGR